MEEVDNLNTNHLLTSHQLVNVREAELHTITILVNTLLIKHQAISRLEAPKFKILAMLKSNVMGSLMIKRWQEQEQPLHALDKLREELELTDPSCQTWECQMLALDRRILGMLSTFQAMLMCIVSKVHLAKVSKANFQLANE